MQSNFKKILIKKIIILLIYYLFTNISCSDYKSDSAVDDSDLSSSSDYKCKVLDNKQLWTGPRGGCYYFNSSGNKTYVDRGQCNNCN